MGPSSSLEVLVTAGSGTWPLTSAGLLVLLQPIAEVAGADGARAGVVAGVGTAPVVGLAAVDNLHLDPCKRHRGAG